MKNGRASSFLGVAFVIRQAFFTLDALDKLIKRSFRTTKPDLIKALIRRILAQRGITGK